MARSAVADVRFDFRGGVNTAFSSDLLDATELRSAKNTRLYPYGSLTKRSGSKRLHATVIETGAHVVNGLYQFHPAAGRQVVALCNGHLFYKLAAAADFTKVASTFSTTALARFAPYRIGSNIYLFIADGTIWRWNGAGAIAAGFTGAPAGTWLEVYRERMFALDGTKTIYWSKIGDPTLWRTVDGGGFADVETYDAEPLTGAQKVGGSLLLCKEDSIARLTGVNNEDIQIDRDTEGVSKEMGLIAPNTLLGAEDFAFLVTQKGPYIATESGIQEIALKVEREFDFANKAYWEKSWAVLNSDRREILLMMPAAAETTNLTGWVLNLRSRAWSGPYVFPYAAATMARYEREDGSDAFMIGGYDGWIRDGDTGSKDDVLSNGTGGTNITLEVKLPELVFGDPTRIKGLAESALQADLGATGSVVVAWSSELGHGSITIASRGAGVLNYPFRLRAKGKRIVLTITDATVEHTQITGVLLNALMEGKGR